MSNLEHRLIFLTIAEPGYSRSWVYYSGLKSLTNNIDFIQIDKKNLIKSFKEIKQVLPKDCIFIVMSPSQYLVPLVRFFLGNKIVLDAGWSLFEGAIISRRRLGFLFNNAVKMYLIDFIASALSNIILLESKSQEKYYWKLLLVRKNKCRVLYTGLDEASFIPNKSVELPPDLFNNGKIVLFRGKQNFEAGLATLAEATLLLENEPITFWVLTPDLSNEFNFSKNTIIERKHMESKGELAEYFKASCLVLGQMSDHARLDRTVPHKAFEAAFSGKPYLTARARGILEVFEEGREMACFSGGDSTDLANQIKMLTENPEQLLNLSKNIRIKYNNICSQKVLTNSFVKIVGQAF